MTTESSGDVYPTTAGNTPSRHADRVRYDVAAIHAVLDEGLVCHVGYLADDRPVVVPSLHVRIDDDLYLHASTGSTLARAAAAGPDGADVCVTVTLVDGIVLARSHVHHSMNYRSVVARGRAGTVADADEKNAVLARLVDHVVPGRSRQSRPPTPRELAATAVLRLPLQEVSLKTRGGPPSDEVDDLELPWWAGVIGVRPAYGPPLPAPELPYDRPVPPAIANYHRGGRPAR